MAAAETPLTRAEFDAVMGLFAPFEEKPHLAVAVSGGADSLALCLLADTWARDHGGYVTALTVDHRLRKKSAREAEQVRAWLDKRGIAHEVLVREGPRPKSNVQAEARAARYRLLSDWCARRGVLHLMLGHHLDDQAETVLLRKERGAGPIGLAAMGAVSERPSIRLLRPLLPVTKARLVATLESLGQSWIEDPTNEDVSHERIRVRKRLAADPKRNATVTALASESSVAGMNRRAAETRIAALLVRSVRLDRLGHVWLRTDRLQGAGAEDMITALGALLATVGGEQYPPRRDSLQSLYEAILPEGLAKARTLGGCRIVPDKTLPALLICRESGRLQEDVRLAPGETVRWDGRFEIGLSADAPRSVRVRRLDKAAWSRFKKAAAPAETALPPDTAALALPGLWDRGKLIGIPALNWMDTERAEHGFSATARFAPTVPLTQAPFSPHPSLPR